MKAIILFALCFLLFFCAEAQQQNIRPKIGLTLSGGGAKGLAHIGILKAIDSAGLKIDYITGTSMGAVIGSLYAIGYSGKQIEKMAKSINWELLLSNQLSLRSISMEEKEEYGRYAVELPYINHKPQLPIAVLDGQELWFKLAELYYPVHNNKDFTKFSIPFKCIAADISGGKAVVLDSGEIITAVRASMAIPSFFYPVNYKGLTLVDGGIIRNFPVSDVKNMGADYVIGSSVTKGLLPEEKLKTPANILLQLVFLKEAEDYEKEIPLCNLFVSQPLDEYSMASFNKADKIIEIGNKEGEKLYPALKHLADSLQNIYGLVKPDTLNVLKNDSVFISSFQVTGLNKTSEIFFVHDMNFHTNKLYSKSDISQAIRRVFGTLYYRSITYSLEPQSDGSSKIIFNVQENPSTYYKVGIHYNAFTGVGIVGNLTTRDFFTKYSRSLLTLNIGENFGLRGEHLQYFDNTKNFVVITKFQLENFKINTYDNFAKIGQYRLLNYEGEMKAEYSGSRNFTGGVGTRYEWKNFKPLIQSELDAKGTNAFFNSFAYLNVNTLNKKVYPSSGVKINAEFGMVYKQNQDVTFFMNGNPVTNIDSADIRYNNYQRMLLTAEAYLPVAKKITFYTQFQSGINFNYKQNLLNNFQIGGLTRTTEDQILFAGLNEATITAPSVAALMIGLNFQLSRNTYLMAKTNAMVNNFISTDNKLKFDNWLTGHALTFGYNSPIGPLDLSMTYCDNSKKVLGYINLGIPF